MTGRVARVTASDNREAIRRLSQDPLTIHETRFDAVRGLVDLMDAALAAAPRFHAPALFLYGGKDELIPDKATAATWRGLPEGPVRAFYPAGYHLLLRDHGRMTPIDDILFWMRHPGMRRCRPGAIGRRRRGSRSRSDGEALIRHGFRAMGLRAGPVAQLDRASPSEGEGRTFESCRVRQSFQWLGGLMARARGLTGSVPEAPVSKWSLAGGAIGAQSFGRRTHCQTAAAPSDDAAGTGSKGPTGLQTYWCSSGWVRMLRRHAASRAAVTRTTGVRRVKDASGLPLRLRRRPLAVTMNFGPLVLTNFGPPPSV